MKEVEYNHKMLELRHGVGINQELAIREMAEREVFLQSPEEQEWRKNLKPGDFCYVADDGGWLISGIHIYRVTKVTRTRIQVLGKSWFLDFYGKPASTIIKWEFNIDDGRFAKKHGNHSYAISSKPAKPHHERGLTEQEFKKRWYEEVVLKPGPFGPPEPEQINQAWLEYKNIEAIT